MGYFPICMDIRGKWVLLIGRGPQTDAKLEKLAPFGAEIRRLDDLTAEDLTVDAAFVVVGDLPPREAARISALCRECRVPVNVVDQPDLCSFFFPTLVTRGDLTISVSTGGNAPGAGAYLGRQIHARLPEQTGEILDWLHSLRQELYKAYPKETARVILHQATERAFSGGKPLTEDEMLDISRYL